MIRPKSTNWIGSFLAKAFPETTYNPREITPQHLAQALDIPVLLQSIKVPACSDATIPPDCRPRFISFGYFGRLRFFNSDFPHLETLLCSLRIRSKPATSGLTVRKLALFQVESMMTLFMTLLVRDEEDIIEENITYHLSQGVDHFIVTDNKSVDNTRDILRKFEKDGLITYIYEDENDYSQSKWVTRMAVLAAEKGADWVINADADEFWYPLNAADLKKCLRRLILYNVAIAQRHDFVCLDKSHGPFYENMIYRKTNSLNPVGKPLPPKVAHRAHTKIHVAQGNHEVSGFRWQRAVPGKLEILHYPLRSREQYENKIRNGGKAYMNNKNLPSKVGNTWRRQYEELMNNGSLKYVTENAFTMDEIDRFLKSNDLIIDRRLVDHLQAMGD